MGLLISTKLVGQKGTEFEKQDKAEKNDFTKKTPEDDGTQAFASRTEGDK